MDARFNDNYRRSWEKLINPDVLRSNLVLASLYITAYETLKNSIVDRIRDFFTFNYDENGQGIPDVRYNEVTRLNRNLFIASCLWLQQNGVIDPGDMEDIMAVREHRNEIAHRLLEILADIDREVSLSYLEKIRHLLQKIEIWWIKEFEIPINPDFDGVEVNEEGIHSGRMILIDLILSTALEGQNTPSQSRTTNEIEPSN